MKAKVITGVLAAVFGITMVALQFTFLFPIALAFFTFMANYELLRSTGVQNRAYYVLTSLPAAAMPFIVRYDLLAYLPVSVETLLFVYAFILLVLMLAMYEKTRFEHFSMALVSSILVPYCMSLLLKIQMFFSDAPQSTRGYLMLFALISAWITDAMAYFTGVKLGKHKMAPRISPKKSWEGAIGGVLGAVVIHLVVYGVYYALFRIGWIRQLWFPVWLVPALSVPLSVISMLGDLSASVIKRNYGIKDFGTIMGEGNGGVMDRFDSAIFVIAGMYTMLPLMQPFMH